MNKERRLSREVAMQLLYQWELQGHLARKSAEAPTFIDHIDVEAYLGHFLHNFYVKDKRAIDTAFIIKLLKGTIRSIVSLDSTIEDTGSSWKLERMDAIDRAILRVSCYELQVKSDVAAKIIINEAIEIAKRYGSEQSPAFINGVLDAIKRAS